MAAMDMTVYPADAVYVKNAFNVLGSVASVSPNHADFIMLPVFQRQTTEVARIKHRRAIEDALLKSNLMCGQEFAVLFNKPDSSANDGRPMAQVCLLPLHSGYGNSPWATVDALQSGRLGPFPLIRVSDMLGYDEVTKPSASARVEQKIGFQWSVFFPRFFFKAVDFRMLLSMDDTSLMF